MARPTLRVVLALAGACAITPAAAQFNPFEALFGPFRPPADVPGRAPPPDRLPPGPPPSQQYPQQYPQQQYPQQYPPSARLPPGPPPGVQSEPLPPPPGATLAPPGAPPGALPRPVQPGQRQARESGEVPPKPNGDIVTPPAQKIANPTAVFSGLDKVTGRTITFDVAVNETVQFGALQVTPRICYTRPPTETTYTDGFVEVDEVTLQGEVRRIFTGWMFAASPGLHAVEHAIYDVWLVDCKGGATVIAETPADGTPAAAPPPRPQRQQRPR
jgi:hypothetical protein